MPNNIGQQIVGTGVNMGINRGLSQIGVRSPLPIPSFYNPNSEHHFADSQAARMARGDRNAWKGYGRRVGANVIDGALMATPIGWANQGIKFVGGLLGKPWGVGNWVVNHIPNGSVTVGDINTNGDNIRAVVDQNTGQVSYMPTFSNYGPYASGYQGIGESDTASPNWDVSYADNNAPDYEGPYGREHYGLGSGGGWDVRQSGSIMPTGNQTLGYSASGGGFGGGVWQGGGGMRSIQVNSGSLSPSNYAGIGGGGSTPSIFSRPTKKPA